ncbi:Exostosin-2 [Hypsibius exemplaris]|uniref:Exostosin-2 n=1 Tax=Hypsibius exemplaris TaxID=2072580 RepID=A0A1W0X4J1_HYPEX|nr:Exostosin-2 [Hypsibius exemplaris]
MYPQHWRWKALKRLFRRRLCWIILFFTAFLLLYAQLTSHGSSAEDDDESSPLVPVDVGSHSPSLTWKNCSHFSAACFNVYRCNARANDLVSVHWPPTASLFSHGRALHLPSSRAFHRTRRMILKSQYYAELPVDACVFVPPVDLLFGNASSARSASLALSASPLWNDGENHLIFSARQKLPFDVASGRLHVGFRYRTACSPRGWKKAESSSLQSTRTRPVILSILVSADNAAAFQHLQKSHPGRVRVHCMCNGNNDQSPDGCLRTVDLDLTTSRFCFAFGPLLTVLLGELLLAGCIPVVPFDSDLVLPFDEVLDWSRSVLRIHLPVSPETVTDLEKLPARDIAVMRTSAWFFWDRYFRSWDVIVTTALQVLSSRIFPKTARTYDEWNQPAEETEPPVFLPGVLAKSVGFTAVILTYDRQDSLLQLISLLGRCPSLAKVVIVWNNQDKAPPFDDAWPVIPQPVRVLRMKKNVLSNRFVPYAEIDTEAVFSLDDDILMLTPDEIEFGFQVWLENWDRLVGFPSRLHVFNTSSNIWEYNSEWGSTLSMVLTGAAFFNKAYSRYYTQSLPRTIRDYVDTHVNCEDLAMNFLIANMTKKGPIKVGPRKKFRCPNCSNQDMLSADSGHLMERSQCIGYFAEAFGFMPLVSVQYRADTTLYKEDASGEEARYPNIGSL